MGRRRDKKGIGINKQLVGNVQQNNYIMKQVKKKILYDEIQMDKKNMASLRQISKINHNGSKQKQKDESENLGNKMQMEREGNGKEKGNHYEIESHSKVMTRQADTKADENV
jgi:hypothetical protein